MFRSHKVLALGAAALALVMVAALPVLAQDDSTAGSTAGYPENTITVTGTGTIRATPDMASVDVGVDVFKPSVGEGFSQANSTIQNIIAALEGIGIAAEDIQTSNLSVYSTSNLNPTTGNNETGYTVSNTIHVIVRDISKAEAVIDTAIGAGATQLYGLSFDFSDRATLERRARRLAMDDAYARARHYATLVSGKIGDAIVITETSYGAVQPTTFSARTGATPSAAVIATGQNDVQIQVNVTYRLVR
jgi:uncharacterized protein YggE